MQLPLNIRLDDVFCFANFFGDSNREPVRFLQDSVSALADSEGQVESVYLYGQAGCGKTHLLQSACRLARELELESVYLPLGETGVDRPQMLEGLGELMLVCIDDIHLVAGNAGWEQALFNLYENIKDHGLLVCAAEKAPSEVGLGLKDLASRLQKGLVYPLRSLAHDQKLEVIRQRARLRGLEISDEVAGYIENHFPRDLQSLVMLLEQLDQESLVQQRRITVPFIRSLFG